MRSRVALSLLVVLLAGAVARAERRDPPGRSTRQIEELTCEFLVPTEAQAEKNGGYSLLIILHGAGGTATGMVPVGQSFLENGFVTCAPKSTAQTWSAPDVQAVKRIAEQLFELYEVPVHRRHAMGFSNGGWNLDPIAFDDKLHFRTATWMAAGCRSGGTPRWAPREMGALALAGSEDANRTAAEGTVKILEKKVKFVDCRLQPGLGHEFTRELVPYWGYFMEVMEGRFEVGRQLSYPWQEDLAEARKEMGEKKRGGFVYIYSKDAAEKELENTKLLQNEGLFARLTTHYGLQLVAVKLERGAAAELIAEAKVKATPAIVVFKPGGEKVAKVLSGKIKPTTLAKTLRSVAKNKALPE